MVFGETFRRALALSIASLFLIAAQSSHAQSNILISGTFVAGPAPVSNSAVAAYLISNGQVTSSPISVWVTNDAGQFTLQVPANQPVLISGDLVNFGSYADPVLGTRQISGLIRAVMTTGSTNANLTLSPLTEAAARYILSETPAYSGAVTSAAITTGNSLASTYILGVDPQTVTPLSAASASAMASATSAQKLFAMAMAGFSKAQEVLTTTPSTCQNSSSSAGTFSSMLSTLTTAVNSGVTLFDSGGGFPADPQNEVAFRSQCILQTGVSQFVASSKNASGVTSLYNLAFSYLGGPTGGTTANVPWTAACAASVLGTAAPYTGNSISARLTAQNQSPLDTALWTTPAKFAFNSFGPSPSMYAAVTIPPDCNRTAWMQYRVLAVANAIVQQQHNYCHHYIPAWNSSGLLFDGNPSYCFDTPPGTNLTTKSGVDCSNFTSFVYNVAFGGVRINGGISEQGGSPLPNSVAANVWSPGTATARPSNWTSYITPGNPLYQQYPFQPGDLIYLAPTEQEAKDGSKISHVVMWTGIQAADGSGRYLTVESFGTTNSGSTSLAQAPYPNAFPFDNPNPANPVTQYLGNAGPNLRFFDGTWRASNMVLYRRIIPMTAS